MYKTLDVFEPLIDVVYRKVLIFRQVYISVHFTAGNPKCNTLQQSVQHVDVNHIFPEDSQSHFFLVVLTVNVVNSMMSVYW